MKTLADSLLFRKRFLAMSVNDLNRYVTLFGLHFAFPAPSAWLHFICGGYSMVVPKSDQREGQSRKTENELTNDRSKTV